VGASFTPGRRCPPDQRSLSGRRLPLPNGQPYTPLKPPTSGVADNGAYKDSLTFTRPAFPLPVAPGWNGNASAFTLGFAPRGYPQRTPGRGRSLGHWTGSHLRQTTSNRCDHSLRATSRRTAALSFNQAAATTQRRSSLTSTRLHDASWRTVSTFHAHETRPGWAPPIPRGPRCSHDRRWVSGRRVPPPPAARPYHPGPHPVVPGSRSRGIIRGSLAFTRPVFPSPGRSPGRNGGP
jgi:hypothetical protein